MRASVEAGVLFLSVIGCIYIIYLHIVVVEVVVMAWKPQVNHLPAPARLPLFFCATD